MSQYYEHNRIINMPASGVRNLARQALQGKWQLAIMGTVIYMVCLQTPMLILDGLFGTVRISEVTRSTPLSAVYLLLVGGAFSFGMVMFFLAIFRKQQTSPGNVFDGFQFYTKSLGLYLYTALFIFLWSLLLLVPGIIAAFRYSQAFFILADDPSKPVILCVEESKRMMYGNKAKLFCICISFVGWYILSAIPGGILAAFVPGVDTNYWISATVSILMLIFTAPAFAYASTAMAAFYEMLTGNLRFEEPAQAEMYGEEPQENTNARMIENNESENDDKL